MTRVPADPHFFRPLLRALGLGLIVLCVLAVAVPAPLEPPADPARPPNPAKSAWFLLWIQEVVSWHTGAIALPVLLAVLLVGLPWLPAPALEHATWFPREHRAVDALVLAAVLVVLALSAVGLFFRGPHWAFVWPS